MEPVTFGEAARFRQREKTESRAWIYPITAITVFPYPFRCGIFPK